MTRPAGFEAVGEGEARLYGPRALLACGLEPEAQEHLLGLADALGAREPLGVVFAGAADAGSSLAELLARPAGHGRGAAPDLPRAIVMSGLAERELHLLMAAWRQLGQAPPLWASLTPHNQAWRLERLLAELAEEHARMSRLQPGDG